MADRQSQGPVFYSILKDVRYMAMLLGPIAADRVRALVEKDIERRRDEGTLPEVAQGWGEVQTKRAGSMLGDAFAGIPIVGLNRYLMDLLKQEAIETFGTIVVEEFAAKGKPKPLEKINFEDLGKSDNFIVQTAYKKLQRQARLGWITDLPFILGFVLPGIHDLIPKETRLKYKNKYFNYLHDEGSERYGDEPKLDEDFFFARKQEIEKYYKAKKEWKEGQPEPVLRELGHIQETFYKLKKKGMHDDEARKEALQSEGYRIAAGWGIQVGLAAKVGFYADYLLNSGTSSYSAIQALRSEGKKDPPHFSENQLTQVYNLFVNEFEGQFPGSTVRKRADGTIEQEKPKSFLGQIWHNVTHAFRSQKQPPFIIKPEIISARSDPKTLGIFSYMAEGLDRNYSSKFEEEGRDLKFDIETFVDLIGRGYIDVNNANYSRALVKYVAHRGRDGIREVEHEIQKIKNANPNIPPHSEIFTARISQMYDQLVEKQLREYFGLGTTIRLDIETEFGTEERTLDLLKTAKLIGTKRLGHYLGFSITGVEQHAAQAPAHVDMQNQVIRLSQSKFLTLQGKVLERATKEFNKDQFGFIETEQEFENIVNFAVPLDGHVQNNTVAQLVEQAQRPGPAWANAVTLLANKIDAIEKRLGGAATVTDAQANQAQGQSTQQQAALPMGAEAPISTKQVEQMQEQINFLRTTLQEVLSAAKNNSQLPTHLLEEASRMESTQAVPSARPEKLN